MSRHSVELLSSSFKARRPDSSIKNKINVDQTIVFAINLIHFWHICLTIVVACWKLLTFFEAVLTQRALEL
jgi:hypothetical protein